MRNSNKCIIPECYVDSCLIEVLLAADKEYVNHHKGNGKVAREMQDNFKDDFCIGIIDEDKEKLDYLKFFEEKRTTDFLKLWKHSKKDHYFIQIRPVVETWILKVCNGSGINLADFNLPTAIKPLLKITKAVSSRRDERLIKLFKQMKNTNCQPVIDLKHWITFLKANKYDSNLDLL
ncbi:MAG: hypothetical protein ABIN67_11455 [Ferruginibacter sp.]